MLKFLDGGFLSEYMYRKLLPMNLYVVRSKFYNCDQNGCMHYISYHMDTNIYKKTYVKMFIDSRDWARKLDDRLGI